LHIIASQNVNPWVDIAPDHFGFAQAAILRRIAQNIRRIRAQAHALARPLAPFFSRDF
jgi:hypothetical protein